jgi:hypothetical protein
MKKILIGLLLCASLSSCLTQKRCFDKFHIVADTVRIVTVRDSIVYRDTTITVVLPGKTVYDTVRIPCPPPPPEFIPDTAKAETTLSRAEAWFSYPFIKLRLIQKDTTITFRLDSALRNAYYWKSEYEKIVNIVPVKKPIPSIYKIGLWLWILVIVVKIAKYFIRP